MVKMVKLCDNHCAAKLIFVALTPICFRHRCLCKGPSLDPRIIRRGWVRRESALRRSYKMQADYEKEEQMLDFVRKTATRGDPSSVLQTIDSFAWNTKWMMNIGDRKGAILQAEVQKAKPKLAVELGAYCGYSAVLIAQHLASDAKLFSLEINPKYANIASQVVDMAGLSDRVTFLVGPADESLRSLKSKSGRDTVDFFFFDHWKDRYLPDLKVIEEVGLLRNGTMIVADNVICPGTPDYLAYIRAHPAFKSTFHKAQLEYRTDVEDGIEVSVYCASSQAQ